MDIVISVILLTLLIVISVIMRGIKMTCGSIP